VRASDRVLLVLAVALTAMTWRLADGTGAAADVPSARLEVTALELPGQTRYATLSRGETLSELLGELGAPAHELQDWVSAAGGALELRALPVGLAAESVVDYHGVLASVRLLPDWRAAVVLERTAQGILARREARPVEREMVVVRGTVSSSLIGAVAAAGEEEMLALALADLFQWDVDFHREVRTGDTFAVLVERVRSEGQTVAYGPILTAEYVNAGRRCTAVRYAVTTAAPGYYDRQGRPLRKQFLRAPLRFSRLTSRFSMSRKHPVLGRRMPHWGVDYGAPAGTPVTVTGDGVVSFVGWRGGGGNTVEVRHGGGYVTAYLHLSRAAAGVHAGAHVRQGQVIGFVGTTGLSTGPHLDYRVTRNGRYVNPVTVGGEPAPPLPPAQLQPFTAWAGRLLPLLAAPGVLAPEAVAQLRDGSPVRFDA
jgi:murein DD-endopeptidase MepM/ murein hydrolase activator NlpD